MNRTLRGALAGALLASTLVNAGCFVLAAGGIAAGTLVAIDRRTVGAQTEDQAIELKARSQLNTDVPRSRISVTSYNRKVLLTGQAASEADKQMAERVVAALSNVRGVHNELVVTGQTGLSTTASDLSITTRVKAALVEAADLQANTIKVVTEAGTVYLMGLVSQREASRAAQVASHVRGVQRVVTAFELISEDEVREASQHRPQPASNR